MLRVSVVGASGSGKTWIASRLAAKLVVPYLELDALRHQSGWQELPDAQFRENVHQFVSQDTWVIDGNYFSVVTEPEVWPAADAVIWVDLPKAAVMRQVIWRTLKRGILRQALWNGNRERVRDVLRWDPYQSIIRWSWTNYRTVKERYEAAMRVKRLPKRPRRVTTAGLRLPLAEMTAAYLGSERARRDALNAFPDSDWPMTLGEAYFRADTFVEELPGKRRGRPPYLDRAHFQEVADIYSAALQRGASPLAAVAGAKHVSKSTAAKWATAARRLGLLPPTVPGRATGAPASAATRSRRS